MNDLQIGLQSMQMQNTVPN